MTIEQWLLWLRRGPNPTDDIGDGDGGIRGRDSVPKAKNGDGEGGETVQHVGERMKPQTEVRLLDFMHGDLLSKRIRHPRKTTLGVFSEVG